MAYEAEGNLYNIGETEQVSGSFKKRRFVLEMKDGTYTQLVEFECTQDKCSLLDNFKTADKVRVHFNIRGREWISPQNVKKYFNTLQAWRIETMDASSAASGVPANSDFDEPPPFLENDDLPF
jgi:single-strand DNA-binding protein